jgi:competence protein ComEA
VRIVLALLAVLGAVAIVRLRPAAPPSPPPPLTWVTPSPSPAPRRTAANGIVVYVAGEVVRPGIYRLASDARIADAVARAGGTRTDADTIAVNLAAHITDGEEIVVPGRGAAPSPRPHRTSAPRARAHRGRPRHAPSRGPNVETVDVNHADAETIAALPGIGPGLAARIVAFRELNGPFASADELLDVAGITERRYAAIVPYIVVR